MVNQNCGGRNCALLLDILGLQWIRSTKFPFTQSSADLDHRTPGLAEVWRRPRLRDEGKKGILGFGNRGLL